MSLRVGRGSDHVVLERKRRCRGPGPDVEA